MKTRTTLLLLALLLGLGVVALISRGPRESGGRGEEGPLFPGLEVAGVRRIGVARPGGEVVLERAGEGWTVAAGEGDAKPADAAAVERALEALAGLAGGTVVSTNPERRERYGLGEGERLSVRVEDAAGEVRARFAVGRGGPDFASSYLVREGEDRVLLVPADLRLLLGRAPEGWRDRAAVGVAADEIDAVRVERAGAVLSLARAEGGTGWLVDGRPADAGPVGRYLGLVSSLRAVAFADPGEEDAAGFGDPEGTVTVEAPERTVVLTVGALDEGSGQRSVRSSRFTEPLLVPAGAAEALLKTAEDFPAPPPESRPEP